MRPLSRAARQALVQQLVDSRPVGSQSELAELLAAEGVSVTQGTVSKDLLELGAVRRRNADGTVRYVIADDPDPAERDHLVKLARLCTEMLLQADASANLVVAHTPPGAAQYFASALDKAGLDSILGTIAGDDTVLMITRDGQGGQQLASMLMSYAAGAKPSDLSPGARQPSTIHATTTQEHTGNDNP